MITFDHDETFVARILQLIKQGVYLRGHAGLREAVDTARSEGRQIAASSGVFDLLHLGHLYLLSNAREFFRDHSVFFLIDGDGYTTFRKGGQRPIVSEEIRALTIYHAAPDLIDHVLIHRNYADFFEKLQIIRPDILFGGPKYEGLETIAGRIGAKAVRVPVETELSSTTWAQILKARLKNWHPES